MKRRNFFQLAGVLILLPSTTIPKGRVVWGQKTFQRDTARDIKMINNIKNSHQALENKK